jgi:hypothetical protein
LLGLLRLSNSMKNIVALFLFLVALANFGVAQTVKTDSLPFSIDLRHSKFKFSYTFLGLTYIYSINGHKPNDSIPENIFLIYQVHGIENNIAARKEFAQSLIKERL